MKDDDEVNTVGHLTAGAAEMAAANIRAYLDAHSESQFSPVKPVNRVMKIAEELSAEMKQVVSASARLAAKSLRDFTGEE